MSAKSSAVLGFGLGMVIAAPLVAPFSLWLFERHMERAGLSDWLRTWDSWGAA